MAVTHACHVKEFTDSLLYMRNGKLYSQLPNAELEEPCFSRVLGNV